MGKKWQSDRRRDRFYKQAKKDNYRSRASYKLKQINRRFKLIRKNNVVLDLGAAPGGWLQVASEIVGEGGFVLGIDLEEIDGFEEENVVARKEDMSGEGVVDKIMEILPQAPDVVISAA